MTSVVYISLSDYLLQREEFNGLGNIFFCISLNDQQCEYFLKTH